MREHHTPDCKIIDCQPSDEPVLVDSVGCEKLCPKCDEKMPYYIYICPKCHYTFGND